MSTHPMPLVGDWVRIVALVLNNAGLPLVDCVGVVLTIEEGKIPQSLRKGIVYTVELLDGAGHGVPSIRVIHDEHERVQDQLEVVSRPQHLQDEYLIHSPTQSVEQRQEIFEIPEQTLELVRRMIAHAARLQFHELAFTKSWPEGSGFELYELPPEIGQLTSLKSLNISHLEIVKLPAEIGQLQNLTKLNAYLSSLSDLPPEIAQLTQLEMLNLAHTSVRELPSEIWQLTQLKTLNLRDMKLTTLPPGLSRLTQLENLDLGYTEIEQLPSEIWQLTQLKTLDISSRKRASLPPEIGNLTELRSLSASSLLIITVPPEIGSLINLQRLSFSHTLLSSLPREIGQLTELESLHLSSTRITHLPVEMANLTHLKELYLDQTPVVFPFSPSGKIASQNAQQLMDALRHHRAIGEKKPNVFTRIYVWFMDQLMRGYK